MNAFETTLFYLIFMFGCKRERWRHIYRAMTKYQLCKSNQSFFCFNTDYVGVTTVLLFASHGLSINLFDNSVNLMDAS